MDYVVKGEMIGGFAMVAWPAEYGVSGVKTFIVNHRRHGLRKGSRRTRPAALARQMHALQSGQGLEGRRDRRAAEPPEAFLTATCLVLPRATPLPPCRREFRRSVRADSPPRRCDWE